MVSFFKGNFLLIIILCNHYEKIFDLSSERRKALKMKITMNTVFRHRYRNTTTTVTATVTDIFLYFINLVLAVTVAVTLRLFPYNVAVAFL
jgi:hypothetical protein